LAFDCDLCGAQLDEGHLDFAADGTHCVFCGAVARADDRSRAEPASLDIGEALHGARVTRGETLEQAARFTRIQLSYLRALEHDDASVFEPFPGMAYARFFLRDYAEHLGVDPGPLVRRFDTEVTTPAVEPMGRTKLQRLPPHPRRWAIGAVVVLIALLVASAAWSQRGVVRGSTSAPAGTHGRAAYVPTGPIGPRGAVDLSADLVDRIVVVVRTTDAPSWVLATADGTVVGEETVQAGEVRRWHARDAFSLRLGNAPAAIVTVNGRRVETPSVGGVANVSLRLRDGVVVAF
jgi:cytoskeleton protein RodZ